MAVPSQFDALSQLFDQITERLIRIEAKLDTKADLATVAAIEGRVRDLEMTRAAKIPQLDATAHATEVMRERITRIEDDLSQRHAVEGFKLDTTKKKLAAAGISATVIGNVVVAILRAFGVHI